MTLNNGIHSDPLFSFTKPVYIWKLDTSSPITINNTCKRCRYYHGVAMGSIDKYRDIRNQIQAMEGTYLVKKEQAIRRASGFNQLFKFLFIKEGDSDFAAKATSSPFTSMPAVPPPAVNETVIFPFTKTLPTLNFKLLPTNCQASLSGQLINHTRHHLPTIHIAF